MYISALNELGRPAARRPAAPRAGARGAVRGAVRRTTHVARSLAPVAAGFVPGAGGVVATQVADRAQRRGAARRPGRRAQAAPPDAAQQAEAARRAEVAQWVDAAQRAEIPRRPGRPARPGRPGRGVRPGLPADVRPAVPGPAVPDFWQRAQPVIDAATGVYVAREEVRAAGRAVTALPRAHDTALERFGDEGGPWALVPQRDGSPGLRAPGVPARGLLPEHQQADQFDDLMEPFATAPGMTPTTMLLIGGIALVAFLALK